MRAEQIGNMTIRVYASVDANSQFRDLTLFNYLMTCVEDKTVNEVCNRLASMQKSDPTYQAVKKHNHAATISGISEQGRTDAGVTRRNPLICIDIDADDNPGMKDPEELARRLVNLPCAYASGRSCSGKGVYVILLLSSNDNDNDFKAAFSAIEEEFRASGIVVDTKCKNVSRLRFSSSYKPYIRHPKDDIKPYALRKYDEDAEPKVHTKVRGSYMGIPKIEILREVISMLIQHGYVSDDYNSWLVDGFALYPLGDEGLQLYDMISRASSNYKGFSDVQKKFSQVSNSNWTEDDCYRRFFGLAKKIIGPGSFNQAIANITIRLNVKNN